jgi:hypothetical protein
MAVIGDSEFQPTRNALFSWFLVAVLFPATRTFEPVGINLRPTVGGNVQIDKILKTEFLNCHPQNIIIIEIK